MRRLYVIFFFSGFPALIYQIVWQRALFTIYGVNVESITVVVTAFMVGLGLGGLIGGAISRSSGIPLLAAFGLIEITIGVFGYWSLACFEHVGTFTLGASWLVTYFVSFGLVLFPTVLMGATLPLLVVHLVRRSGNVGRSVGVLYFVNTLGSAVACFVAALWLLGAVGMKGSVRVGCVINFLVGAGALGVYVASRGTYEPPASIPVALVDSKRAATGAAEQMVIRLPLALVLVALCGYISLSYEILWMRVYSFMTGGLAASFALVLGSFLAGLAFGSLFSRRFCRNSVSRGDARRMRALVGFVFLANAIGFCVIPAVAYAACLYWRWTLTLPIVTLATAMLGATFPLISHLCIKPDERVGSSLSYLYVANIVGSAGGSLITGFVLMDVWSIGAISAFLAILGLALCGTLLLLSDLSRRVLIGRLVVVAATALGIVVFVRPLFDGVYERLQWKTRWSGERFAHLVETRSGVISVGQDGRIYGGGIYDGAYSLNLMNDVNGIVRPFALSLIHPDPKDVLSIGLSSGSWTQVLVSHPQLERLTVIEINPGYLKLIPLYPEVASLLRNPKLTIVIDDGRRWLNGKKDRHFDVIVMNTTYHWRANTTNLLSLEFLKLARSHLKPNGILFFNTTWSDEVQRTAAIAFPHALRVSNFMAVSDQPIVPDEARWVRRLEAYVIDGKAVLDLAREEDRRRLKELRALTHLSTPSANGQAEFLETRESILARTKGARLIRDDNMGTEWRADPQSTVGIPFPLPLGRLLATLVGAGSPR